MRAFQNVLRATINNTDFALYLRHHEYKDLNDDVIKFRNGVKSQSFKMIYGTHKWA